MSTVIEKVLSTIGKVTAIRLKVLANILGFPAEIYYPQQYDSLLDDDAKITYNSTPDEVKNVLIAGVYNSPFLSPGIFNSFEESFSQDEEIVWYLSGEDNPPPIGSKVVLTINNKKMSFQVSYVREDVTRNGAYYEVYLTPMR